MDYKGYGISDLQSELLYDILQELKKLNENFLPFQQEPVKVEKPQEVIPEIKSEPVEVITKEKKPVKKAAKKPAKKRKPAKKGKVTK